VAAVYPLFHLRRLHAVSVAILIVYSMAGCGGTTSTSGGPAAVLHAYDAANLATELYNSKQAAGGRDQFSGNKFITAMIANGKVFVGTPNSVAVFGLL
jgi:hypothetical protein